MGTAIAYGQHLHLAPKKGLHIIPNYRVSVSCPVSSIAGVTSWALASRAGSASPGN